MAVAKQTKAPLIAIIGCDGSGKSTVSEQALKYVSQYGKAVNAHLGKQAGNVGRALANLPLIGSFIGNLIRKKTKSVNKSQTKNKAPGIFPAIVMYAFTLRRLRRFRRMLALREEGFIIVADRFPQLDFPLSYDGPQLDINAQGNFIVRWLARREHAAFQWMTQYQPDLVIRLNVDIDTAYARKPDHVRESLQKKIEITPLLTFNGAPIVEINSAQPLEQVLAETEAAIDNTLVACGYQKSS
jgi:thymidylate kinase